MSSSDMTLEGEDGVIHVFTRHFMQDCSKPCLSSSKRLPPNLRICSGGEIWIGNKLQN